MPDAGPVDRKELDAAEIGAIAHLYRGEVYRSTLWRTRLDTTTNWSVVTLGIALSIAFSSPAASALPLILVGILIVFFLMLEARRYRYFNVWRARCRWMEVHFFAPMLHDGDLHMEDGWQRTLAEDYWTPRHHVSMRVAVGRRIRRNYFWILLIQTSAYIGKLVVHPTPLTSFAELTERAAIGPLPGSVVLVLGAGYCVAWGVIAAWSWRDDTRRALARADPTSMG
ncbi:DUF2270 domain-containing protein [Roseisalinus antarcticus]|uniref:DUF2270 domain-containing protein n=1 Tax=Roseisalinus antarcticus TaxID=254357 RepID=A0A1Y5SKZ6_9RHOB|nr:DUF2270 domain-containing protein [Roseisalinus antarcticus]SLN42835.1 hypothetical protein ROA7023_01732 [Roseisalinus antarcticus]